MSLVNGGAVGDFDPANDVPNIDNELTNDFNGYRDLDPGTSRAARRGHRREVRERGPFLSLSEFVNRRIGPASDDAGRRPAGRHRRVRASTTTSSPAASPMPPSDVASDIYEFPTPACRHRQSRRGRPRMAHPGRPDARARARRHRPRRHLRHPHLRRGARRRRQGHRPRLRGRRSSSASRNTSTDPNRPSTNVWDSGAKNPSPDNIRFGRRLGLISFRWLSEAEI